ncbi:SDR family oxidoreductase [Domibacillus sp. PGB-M46]|uniref:SDR family oxidoreductase n=1 Tax=Domibacillus sp. PGB-M46 TaxID=2910255 RepID=UPI001F595FC0|nr:SDR family oxidoreductase [Domibacillus sp. PGB-M46]MCI2256051.1 SDR family oxidoreductase [Domibacillus sp. PGB-M46]
MILNPSLKGKTIVITGSSKGIGKETAELLLENGANVVLESRSSKVNRKEHSLELPVGLTSEGSVEAFCKQAMAHFGTIDVLINSAGTGTSTSIIDSSTEDFDQMIAVNLRGTYLNCKCFGRHMEKKQQGHTINLISIAGTTALAGGGGYFASKFGPIGLIKVLQFKLRTKGVQVTAVLPGAFSSSFWDQINPKPNLSNIPPKKIVAQHLMNLINQPSGAYIDKLTIMPPLGIV